MADYKGLTIRIGGDTEPLQRALKAASSAAFATQRDMQALTRAMKFDGNNFAGLQRNAQLTKNKMEDLATKASELKVALKQLGGETTNVGGAKNIAELARNTGNTELAAKKATQRYNELNKMLETNYTSVEKLINAQVPLNKTFDFHDKSSITSLIDDMKQLGVFTEQDAQHFKTLANSGHSLEAAASAIRQIKDNSNLLGDLDNGQLSELERLSGAWDKAAREQEAYNKAAQFDKMRTDLTSLNAEVEGLGTKLGQVHSNIKMGKGFDDAKVSLERLDKSTQEATEDLKKMSVALKADPTSTEAVKRGLADLGQISSNAKAKVEILNKQLQALKDRGADNIAKNMGDTATAVAKAADEVSKLSVKYAKAKGEVEKYVSQLDRLDRNSTDKQSDEWKQTEAALQNAKSELEKYGTALDKAKANQRDIAAGAEFKRVESEAQGAKVEVDKVTEAVKAVKSGRASIQDVADGFDKLKTSAKQADDTIRAGQNISNVGTTITAGVTAPIIAAGTAMVDATVDVDTAYRDMRKTVDGTEGQFRQLKDHAKEFASTHFTSADQILQIEALGGELGVATENLEGFATAVANIDIATDLDSETAATELGHLQNIMHLGANDYSKFADSLVRLGNNGASTESEIMNIATRIGSIASICGMSAPDVLAWSSSIASTGQNSEAAGTAISKTMQQIEGAVGQGGDVLKSFADVAGMSAEDFANTWNSNPTEALKKFIEGLKHIEENGGSADATLTELGITGVRQKQGIEGLMQVLGGLNDNLTMSSDAWNGVSDKWGAAGDAAREAGKKTEGFSGVLQRMQNMSQNVLSDLGDAATPFIQNLLDKLKALYDWFGKIPNSTKVAFLKVAAGAAAIGPLITMLGKAVTGFGALQKAANISSGVAKFVEAVQLVRGGAGTITEALSATGSGLASITALFNPMNLAIVGVTAVIGLLATAWLDYQAKQEEAREHQEKLDKAFATTRDNLDGVKGAVDDTKDSYDALKKATEDGIDVLIERNENARQAMQDLSDQGVELDVVTDKITTFIDKMGGVNDTSKLTAGEVDQLKEAFRRYNEIMGTNYGITDNTITKDGEKIDALDKLNSALEQNAEMWKYNATMRALTDQQVEYEKTAAEAKKTADKAQKDYEDKKSAYDKAAEDQNSFLDGLTDKYGDYVWTSADNRMQILTGDEQAKYNELADAVNNASTAMESSKTTAEEAANAYKSAKNDADDYGETADALAELQSRIGEKFQQSGIDVTAFGRELVGLNVTREQVQKMSDGFLDKALKDANGDEEALANTLARVAKAQQEIVTHFNEMPSAAKAITDAGKTVDGFAEELAEAGIDMSKLSSIGDAAFASIFKSCDGNTQLIAERLTMIENMHLSDKGFTVSDNGTLELENGAVIDFNNMTLGDKKFTVSDDGTITLETGEVLNLDNLTLDNKPFRVLDDGTITTNEEDIHELDIKRINDKSYQVSDNDTNARTQALLGQTQDAVNKLAGGDYSFEVNAKTDKAIANITWLQRYLDMLPKNITIRTHYANMIDGGNRTYSGVPKAKGGVVVPHARGGINLHADGGYSFGVSSYTVAAGRYSPATALRLHEIGGIATQSTWYSPTDIVGEAGAEAIVPLTNRHYANPFVSMIADGIVDRLNSFGTDAATAAQVAALRQELPQLMATYQTKIGGREFTRMINKYGSMNA